MSNIKAGIIEPKLNQRIMNYFRIGTLQLGHGADILVESHATQSHLESRVLGDVHPLACSSTERQEGRNLMGLLRLIDTIANYRIPRGVSKARFLLIQIFFTITAKASIFILNSISLCLEEASNDFQTILINSKDFYLLPKIYNVFS